MILEEPAHLNCRPEAVIAFFEALDHRYLEWHPDHIAFKWLGGTTERRSRFFFDERIGPWRLRMVMTMERQSVAQIRCTPYRRVWRLVLREMTFSAEPERDGTRYTHRIVLRLGPFAGLAQKLLLVALRRHMAQESENLRRLACS